MRRMRSLVTELHRRVARDLCSNYELILLPEYSASQMVCRRHRVTGEARKIPASVVRGLLAWRPYQFKQFLLHKAREFSNCTVVIVDEVCLLVGLLFCYIFYIIFNLSFLSLSIFQ